MANKRTKLAALCVAGSVFAWASCEQLQQAATKTEGAQKQEYTEDGRPLYNIGVGVSETPGTVGAGDANGPSGALYVDLAKGWNFAEVLFQERSNGPYYSASAIRPETLKIAVPAGTYDHGTASAPTNGRCILLLGAWNNGNPLLYAIGVIDGGNKTISATSDKVDFTAYALRTDITAKDTLAYTTSAGTVSEMTGYIDGHALEGSTIKSETPYFSLPMPATTLTTVSGGKFTIIVKDAAVPATNFDGLKSPSGLPPPPPPYPANYPQVNAGLFGYQIYNGSDSYPAFEGITVKSATNPLSFAPGKIEFNFTMEIPVQSTPPQSAGFGLFYFDIPVYGLDGEYDPTSKRLKSNKKAWAWLIRNGISNTGLDSGLTEKSATPATDKGNSYGGVLFEVGEAARLLPVTATGPTS